MSLTWLWLLLALYAHALLAFASSLVARRMLGHESASLTLSGAIVVFLALEYSAFMPLAWLGLFSRGPVLAFLTLATLVIWRVKEPALKEYVKSRELVIDAVMSWRAAHTTPSLRLLGCILGTFALLTLFREVLTPPIAWDEMTYQATRPAFWVQNASLFIPFEGSAIWTLFETREPLGNIVTSWAMVLPMADTLIAPVWFGVLLGCWVATYALARQLEVAPTASVYAAWGATLTPALFSNAFTALVDNVLALLVACAISLALHFDRSRHMRSAALAAIALTLALLVKKTSFPLVGVVALALVVSTIRHRRALDVGLMIKTLSASLALLIAWFSYLWLLTENPLFPYEVNIGGHIIFEGGVTADGTGTGGRARPLLDKLEAMFVAGYNNHWSHHINFGVFFLVIAPLSLLHSLVHLIKGTNGRVIWALALIGAWFLFLFIIWSPTGSGLNEARYAAASVPLLAIGFALGKPRSVATVGNVWLVSLIVYAIPVQFGPTDASAMGTFALVCLPFVGLGALVGHVLKTTPSLDPKKGALVGLLVGFVFCVEEVRSLYRYDHYEDVQEGLSHTNNPVGGNHGLPIYASRIFEQLDQEKPQRIAVTVGWDGRGINWFLYPLFGQRLQNTLVHVPHHAPGTPSIDRVWPPVAQKFAGEAWFKRLRDAEVDYVVSLAPITPEAFWMRDNPSYFTLVGLGPYGVNLLFEVHLEGNRSAPSVRIGKSGPSAFPDTQ